MIAVWLNDKRLAEPQLQVQIRAVERAPSGSRAFF